MPITYDPLDYAGNTGTAISNIGSQIAQTVASIPSLLKADKAYKLAEEAHKTEDNLKTAAYTGTNSLFQKLGLNKSVRAPMKGETKDDYLQYLASEFHPLLTDENGGLDNSKFAAIKERLGQIGLGDNKTLNNDMQVNAFLSDSKPIQQTNSGAGVVPQVQGSQPQQTTPVQPENPFADWTDKDFFSGLIKEPSNQVSTTGTPIDLPGSTGESSGGSNSIVDVYKKHMDESIANLNKGVKGGYVSVADAEKQRQGYVDRLADLTMQEMKNRLEERKLRAKEAEKQSMDEAKTRQQQDFEKEKMKTEHDYRLGEIAEQKKANGTTNKRQDAFLARIDATLRNDTFVKNYTDQLGYAGNTVSLLMSDNPVANQAAKTQLARLSGEVGVLTDRDVERFGGSKAVIAKAKQVATEVMSGRLTEENRQFLLAVAQRFEENARGKLDERLQNLALGQSKAFEIPYEMVLPLVDAYGSGRMASPSAQQGGIEQPPASATSSGAVPVGKTITHSNGVKITRIE